ncbi:uncharacterized protein LOC131939931 [Physella acuta]|uniref:uncharacterized protein LOC131939931 n=1 Tax=Physella acuta TaxID=109671 RepID=UPI0027DD708B|nr:uncharacterized protein LOC131939931 [Physella acuta]
MLQATSNLWSRQAVLRPDTTRPCIVTMALKLLLCLLVVVAVLALTAQAAPRDVSYGTKGKNLVDDTKDDNGDVFGDDKIDGATEIDGIALKDLTRDELHDLMEDVDNRVMAELDILVGKLDILKRKSRVRDTRQKRQLPRLVFEAARALFRGSTAGRVTSSGARVTRQYQRPGNYQDAVRDFNRFSPINVKTFNGKVSGQTGTMGNHRITVRNGSSNGSPTLEIRSPKGNGEFVRKFRYNNK